MAEEQNINLENLSVVDLANLSQQVNSSDKYSVAQRHKVEALVWKKIRSIAGRASKLDPSNKEELKAFRSILDNLPLAYRMETSGLLPTVKRAETRLYNAENGIDDRSLGEKARDGLNEFGEKLGNMAENAKDNINQFGSNVGNSARKNVKKLKHNTKVGYRFMRMAANRGKNNAKNWVKGKQEAYAQWSDRMDDKINAWMDKADKKLDAFENRIKNAPKKLKHNTKVGYRFMRMAANRGKNNAKNWVKGKQEAYAQWSDRMDDKINAWIDKAAQKIENFQKGINNAAKNTVNAGKKLGNNMAQAGKRGLNSLQRGYMRAKNIINGIKLPSVKGHANEKSSALDLANGNLSKLNPEQIKDIYNELKQYRFYPIGDKNRSAYYRFSTYSTDLLNKVKAKGMDGITDENADKIAAWLEINKNIQEEVNFNRAKENNERNDEVEGLLKQRQAERNGNKTERTADEKADNKTREEQHNKADEKQEQKGTDNRPQTFYAAEYGDYARSLGKEADDEFMKECREGKYKDDFEKFVSDQRSKYAPKQKENTENKSAENEAARGDGQQARNPGTEEKQETAAREAGNPKQEQKAEKDLYEGLNLSDSQRKIVEGEFNQLKDIYNNPEKWNLADNKNKEAALSAYKESLKMQGLNDNQVSDVLSRQRDSVKDKPEYKDMFKENIGKREAAHESSGVKDVENNTGVDRLAEKARRIQKLRGLGENNSPRPAKTDDNTQTKEIKGNDQAVIKAYQDKRQRA